MIEYIRTICMLNVQLVSHVLRHINPNGSVIICVYVIGLALLLCCLYIASYGPTMVNNFSVLTFNSDISLFLRSTKSCNEQKERAHYNIITHKIIKMPSPILLLLPSLINGIHVQSAVLTIYDNLFLRVWHEVDLLNHSETLCLSRRLNY